MRFWVLVLILSFLFLVGAAVYYLLRDNEDYLPDSVPLVAPELKEIEYEEYFGKG